MTELRSKQSNFYGSSILQEERKVNAALWDPSFRAASFLAAACRTASLPLGQGHRRTLEKHGGKNEKQKKGNTKREKTAELTMCDFSVWLADGRQVEVGQWGDNWAGVRALFRFLVRAPTRVRVRVRAGA